MNDLQLHYEARSFSSQSNKLRRHLPAPLMQASGSVGALVLWVVLHAVKLYDERQARAEKEVYCEHAGPAVPTCDEVARLLTEVNKSVVRGQELPQTPGPFWTWALIGLVAAETVALIWCLSWWLCVRRTTAVRDEALPGTATASLVERPRRRGGGVLQ